MAKRCRDHLGRGGDGYPDCPDCMAELDEEIARSEAFTDSKMEVLQEAAYYCQRSADAWKANGFLERAYAAERLAKDFAEQAAVAGTSALHAS